MTLKTTALYIHAAAALGGQQDYTHAERKRLRQDPDADELKNLSKSVLGQTLRQASHFVELAAIGAQLCLQRLPRCAPADTAVYLGTGLGEVRKTVSLFQQASSAAGLVSPFDFINATNNMAAFYVAKLADLRARNLTVMQEEFSFEWALTLAAMDIKAGAVNRALVGGVDENSHPRAEHMRRLPLKEDQIMGEGSGWIYLTGEPVSENSRRALGEILSIEQLPDIESGTAHFSARTASAIQPWLGAGEPAYLLPGFALPPEHACALTQRLPQLIGENYLDYCGCYHTAAAFGVAAIFDRPHPTSARYFHINSDNAGRTMMIGVQAFGER